MIACRITSLKAVLAMHLKSGRARGLTTLVLAGVAALAAAGFASAPPRAVAGSPDPVASVRTDPAYGASAHREGLTDSPATGFAQLHGVAGEKFAPDALAATADPAYHGMSIGFVGGADGLMHFDRADTSTVPLGR